VTLVRMLDDNNLVEELLDMAKEPDAFSKSELGIMLLVAATEIIKLRERSEAPSSEGAGGPKMPAAEW
jgi:hypothetical protein